jgi:hypothetical protein
VVARPTNTWHGWELRESQQKNESTRFERQWIRKGE